MTNSLAVPCPICNAAKGKQCEDVANGYIVNRHVPHIYRMQVAQEDSFADRLRSAADLLDEIGDLYGGAK
jgi:hypothetical protein